MEPFRVHILGCGSALPTMKHNPSAQVLEIRGKFFMVDCGEGVQLQLRRAHVGFSRVSSIFITHLHGDHCFGLIGLISTFGLLGRTAPLHVYAPEELEKILLAQLDMFCRGLEYEVVFHAVDTTVNRIIYEDRNLTVETLPLDHRVPCCGFLFREKKKLPHIRRDMIDFWKIPLAQINNIKNGAGWVTEDGQQISHEKLTMPSSPPRSYAYCSDTRYMHSLCQYLKGIDVLYHEATYGEELKAFAQKYCHSTARQAASIARDAAVGKLYLGHYSARYDDEQEILKEAQEVFPNSFLTCEGLTIDV